MRVCVQNLLICAPTGAGKTNCALLAVLHEIERHIDEHGVLSRDMFKIVYIAPMKALAAEVAAKFQERLSPLGITVKELTGDMQLTKVGWHVFLCSQHGVVRACVFESFSVAVCEHGTCCLSSNSPMSEQL